MANEAKVVTLLGNKGDPIEYTVAPGSPIPKGTLMYLASSPMTVKSTDNTGSQIFAGIAAEEFVSGTQYASAFGGSHTVLACWTHGVFELTASSSLGTVFGQPVTNSSEGPNLIASGTGQDAIDSSPEIVGIAYDTIPVEGTGNVLINVGRTY